MSTNGKNYPVGLQKKDGRNARFREYLKGDDIIVAPGAFDCISARLVENAGFPAVYLTGAGMSMSMMGAPDLGMVTFGEILERVRRIADAVTAPVICDADTGYGGPLNVMRTRSEEHTSELQSLMRISYAVFCLKKKQDFRPRYH